MTKRVEIDPWNPDFATPNLKTARALRAVASGKAEPEQQKLVMDWMQIHVCVVGANAFVEGRADSRDWRLGRQWVGQHIRRILATDPELFRNGEKDA